MVAYVRWPTTVTAKQKVSRQKQKAHGKTKSLTAKTKSPRQNKNVSRQKQKAHGNIKSLTAKTKGSRQKQQAYGKNKRLTAKAKTSRQERNLKGAGYYAEIWERKGVQHGDIHGAEFHTHVETKMFCANCGTELAAAANFCVKCGQGKTVLCFSKFIVI